MLDLVNQPMPILAAIIYVIIITTYFIAFRSENTVFCVIAFVIGSAFSVCTNIVFKLAYNIKKYSEEFLFNFAVSTSRSRGRDAAEDRRFFKSCQSLYCNIGEYSTVSRNLFSSVMHEIIINITISLLLAIPS